MDRFSEDGLSLCSLRSRTAVEKLYVAEGDSSGGGLESSRSFYPRYSGAWDRTPQKRGSVKTISVHMASLWGMDFLAVVRLLYPESRES